MSGSYPLMPHIPLQAELVHDITLARIKKFEKELTADEEVGLMLVGTPDARVMHITDMSWHGSQMIIFFGVNEHGRPMQLVQHCTQVNILLTAVPKQHDKARRIGFALSASEADDE